MTTPRQTKVDGALIAEVLRGSWRSAPPDLGLTPGQLEVVNERLQATGAGGLGWWRIRDSELADGPTGAALRDAFRLQSINARLHEERILIALEILEAAGVEPLLAKGWAVARWYPKAGLRPYGDIDLLVAPGQFDAAHRALALHAERTDSPLRVDLHSGVRGREGQWAPVMERSETAQIGDRALRVLGPEDHLGLLCPHFLSHGAWRPLWLCDIALICESLACDFDWEYLQGLPRRQVEETRVAVRLAHEVLGASIEDTPWYKHDRLPKWIPAATLAAWSHEHYSTTTSFGLTEARAGSILSSLRLRWPNPIEVTSRWRAPYNGAPRLPLQLIDACARGGNALLAAPAQLSRRITRA